MKELRVIYRGFDQEISLGTLADDGTQVLFQYSAQALDAKLDLSPLRLPLRQAAYPDRLGEFHTLHDVPGLIADSLPDGWGFRLMHRRLKTAGIKPSHLSTLDHLAYLGDNTMGALTYQPTRPDPLSDQDLSLLALAHEIEAVQNDDAYEVLAELARAGGSPGGARPKAMVYLQPDTQELRTQATRAPTEEAWLVKFAAAEDASDSVAVEALYAQMAKACELGMSATQLFDLPRGQVAFGTQRFDRRGAQRVHVHSLAGLLHVNFQIPALGYDDFFRATRRLTRDQRELVKAVRLCTFNILMNNRDDHAKNFSFVREADGSWRLAPPYDLSYNPGYRGEHFLDIAGEGKSPTRSHILTAAMNAGLPRAVANQAVDEVLAMATPERLVELAKGLPVNKATVTTLTGVMRVNRKGLAT